jgi:hypothetical protein
MDKDTATRHTSAEDLNGSSRSESEHAQFERPSIEEISLCCEISAYAPDGDDRPLF